MLFISVSYGHLCLFFLLSLFDCYSPQDVIATSPLVLSFYTYQIFFIIMCLLFFFYVFSLKLFRQLLSTKFHQLLPRVASLSLLMVAFQTPDILLKL